MSLKVLGNPLGDAAKGHVGGKSGGIAKRKASVYYTSTSNRQLVRLETSESRWSPPWHPLANSDIVL